LGSLGWPATLRPRSCARLQPRSERVRSSSASRASGSWIFTALQASCGRDREVVLGRDPAQTGRNYESMRRPNSFLSVASYLLPVAIVGCASLTYAATAATEMSSMTSLSDRLLDVGLYFSDGNGMFPVP